MDYEGFIIRPPSEVYNLLLLVTVGIFHNTCTFCCTYRQKKFQIKPFDRIKENIEARSCDDVNMIFLCDGGVLIIPYLRLEKILELIKKRFNNIKMIWIYEKVKGVFVTRGIF